MKAIENAENALIIDGRGADSTVAVSVNVIGRQDGIEKTAQAIAQAAAAVVHPLSQTAVNQNHNMFVILPTILSKFEYNDKYFARSKGTVYMCCIMQNKCLSSVF